VRAGRPSCGSRYNRVKAWHGGILPAGGSAQQAGRRQAQAEPPAAPRSAQAVLFVPGIRGPGRGRCSGRAAGRRRRGVSNGIHSGAAGELFRQRRGVAVFEIQ